MPLNLSSIGFDVDTGALDRAARSLDDFGAAGGRLAGILRGLGPAGVIAVTAMTTFAGVMAKGVQEAAKAELQFVRIEAVLRATGNASGLTSRQLTEFAAGLAQTSMASEDQIQAATVRLLTFRRIAGETFKEVLRLSADLSSAGFGELSQNAFVLGRALEDPLTGMTNLRRMGILFDPVQKKMIENFVATGQKAKAMEVILNEVRSSVGGTGSAARDTLTGSMHALSEATGEWFEAIGNTAPIATFKSWINSITGAINEATHSMSEFGAQQDRINDKENQLRNAKGGRNSPEMIKTLENELRNERNKLAIMQSQVDVEEELARRASARAQAEIQAADDTEAAITSLQDRFKQFVEYYDGVIKEDLASYEDRARKHDAMIDRIKKGIDDHMQAEDNKSKRIREAQSVIDDVIKNSLTVEEEYAQKVEQVNAAMLRLSEEGAPLTAEKLLQVQAALTAQDPAMQHYVELWEYVSESIYNVLVDAFSGARVNILSIMRDLASRVAAMLVFKPIVGNIMAGAAGLGIPGAAQAAVAGGYGSFLGGAGGAGGGSMLGAGASALSSWGASSGMFGSGALYPSFTGFAPTTGMLGGTATLGATLGAGALGAIGGNLLAGALGLNRTGGSIGGGIGAAIGMMTPLGPLGALLGGAAGSVLGGLFGPGMSDETGYSDHNLSTGGVRTGGLSGNRMNQGNIDAAKRLGGIGTGFAKFLSKASGQNLGGRMFFEVGNRDGITGDYNGQRFYGGSDEAGAGQVIGGVVRAMANELESSLPPALSEAIRNIDFSGDLEAAMAKLDSLNSFVDFVSELDESLNPTSALQQSLTELMTHIEGLGVSSETAAGLVAQVTTKLRVNFNKTITDDIMAITDPLGFALKQVGEAMQDLRDDAEALGGDLTSVNTLSQLNARGVAGGVIGNGGDIALSIMQMIDPMTYELTLLARDMAVLRTNMTALGYTTEQLTTYENLRTTQIRSNYTQPTAPTLPGSPMVPAVDLIGMGSRILQGLIRSIEQQAQANEEQIRSAEELRDTWQDLRESVRMTRQDIMLDTGLSILSPSQLRDEAFSQLEAAAAKARGGDPNAVAEANRLARATLDASLSLNAKTAAYVSDFDRVQSIMAGIEGASTSQITIAQNQLSTLIQIRDSLVSQGNALTSGNNTLVGRTPTTGADLDALQVAHSEARAAWFRGGGTEATWAASNTQSLFKDEVRSALTNYTGDRTRLEDGYDWRVQNYNDPVYGSWYREMNATVDTRKAQLGFNAGGGLPSGWSVVGEQGPELAYMPSGSRVWSSGESQSMMSTAGLERRQEITCRILQAGFTTLNMLVSKLQEEMKFTRSALERAV